MKKPRSWDSEGLNPVTESKHGHQSLGLLTPAEPFPGHA